MASSLSFSGGEKKTITETFTKTNYYPLCVAGFRSSSQFTCFNTVRLSAYSEGSATITMDIKNLNDSNASMNIYSYILWMKI